MKDEKVFEVTVDGEKVEIPRENVTPILILEKAGLDPADRYLIQIIGQKMESYKDDPEQDINVHQNQVFITGKLGAVAVA
jgi:hypothetical protein